MAGYLSPATFSNNNLIDYRINGPAAGYMAALNQITQRNVLDREFRDSDQAYDIQELKRRAAESDLPVHEAENANKLSQAQLDQEQYANGTKRQSSEAAIAAQIAKDQATVIKSKEDAQKASAPLIIRANEEFQARGGKFDWNNPDDIQWWQQTRQGLEQAGVKGLPMVPDQGTPLKMQQWAGKAKLFLESNAQASRNTASHLNDMEKIREQGENAARVASINEGKTLGAAAELAAARRYVADQARAAKEAKAQADNTVAKIQSTVINNIKKNGGIKDADDFEAVTSVARDNAAKDLAKNPEYQKLTSQYTGNKAAAEKMLQDTVDNLGESLVPGYKKAKQKLMGGGTPSSAAPKIDPQMKAAVEAVGGAYEPDKYDYRINPATGKPQRAPKQ